MTNITLSAPEELIAKARQNAVQEGTTLNQKFRDWLADQAADEGARRLAAWQQTMAEVGTFTTARKYTREEMNER